MYSLVVVLTIQLNNHPQQSACTIPKCELDSQKAFATDMLAGLLGLCEASACCTNFKCISLFVIPFFAASCSSIFLQSNLVITFHAGPLLAKSFPKVLPQSMCDHSHFTCMQSLQSQPHPLQVVKSPCCTQTFGNNVKYITPSNSNTCICLYITACSFCFL